MSLSKAEGRGCGVPESRQHARNCRSVRSEGSANRTSLLFSCFASAPWPGLEPSLRFQSAVTNITLKCEVVRKAKKGSGGWWGEREGERQTQAGRRAEGRVSSEYLVRVKLPHLWWRCRRARRCTQPGLAQAPVPSVTLGDEAVFPPFHT